MSVGIGVDKSPVALTQYRSQGDTIPYVVKTGETWKVGDIVPRGSTPGQLQQIGQVQSLSANSMSKGVTTGDANQGYSTDVTAVEGDQIELRIFGMVWAPAAADTYEDADMVEWNGTAFEADTTGAHEVVGRAVVDGTDVTHILVRMNVLLRAATP